MLPIESPFKTYTGLDGKPLNNGYVYFGLPYQNPVDANNQVTVYLDSAGTIPASQPLRTVNGYLAAVAGGSPVNVFFDDEYSEVVQDSKKRQVFYARTSADFSLISLIKSAISGVGDLAKYYGSSLIGFIQAGVGAVLGTVQDELRRTISPEQFGAKCNGSYDDALGIQKAIDSFPQGASCSIRLTPNKTYLLKTPISTNNRSVVIDGNNAIILIGANMTYGLQIIGTNCELRNVQVNRAAGVVVTAGIYVAGLQHVLRNVTSRAQTWVLFILCQDMKESHFTNLRVDNDVTGNTGTVIQLDYCVNNTISNSMLGFCAQAIYGSGLGQPVSNYHNEGILISDVITVYAGKAINFDNGTFIAISNCCFDFCEIWGVFVSNGTDLSVVGTWIASNLTNGFIGIGAGSNVKGITVQACRIVRGAAAITGTAGFSLPGQDALIIGNRLTQGMNGGVVTHPTSQVIGNAVSGTAIFSDESAVSVRGSLAVSKVVQIDGSLTVAGSSGIFPSALSGSANAGAVGTSAPPATVAAFGVVNVGGTTYKLPLYNP